MRRIRIRKRALTTALVVLACLATGAAAQQTGSLLKGFDSRIEVQAGIYSPGSSGSQSAVREYDGRNLNWFGVELLDAYGYNNAVQYWITMRDIAFVQDEYISFGLTDRNAIKFTGSTSMLRHRFSPVPAANPWVAEQLSNLVPAPPGPVAGQTWDTFKDLSPGSSYGINRRVNQLGLCVTPDTRQRLALLLDWWQEREHGNQQFLFRARQTTDDISNRDKGSVLLPVDRDTNEASIGTDLAVGRDFIVNYRFTNTTFDDNRTPFAAGSRLDLRPLNSLTRIGSETKSHVIKARSKITDKLDFTGVHINRERRNARSDIPDGHFGAGTILDKMVETSATNLAFVYRPSRSLSFTGRWREFDRDDRVPAIFGGDEVPDDTPANDTLSSDLRSTEVEGVYTGIRRVYLRGGYENRKKHLEPGELSPTHPELILPATGTAVDWDIYRAAFRYHPFMRLNVSANYEHWSCPDSGFTGAPNNRRRTTANATYMIRDNAAIYGDFSRWHDFNDQIRVEGDIPTPATDDAEEEMREEAAGQGLDSDYVTTTFGGWYALTDKLTLDINAGTVIMDSGANWVLGTNPSSLPHLPVNLVPFKSNTKQWSLGANYRIDRRHSLYCRFVNADSEGASLVIPSDFANLGPQWTPLSIEQNTYTIGLTRGLGKRDSLSADYSRTRWCDEVDAGQSGRYNLFRMSWSRQY